MKRQEGYSARLTELPAALRQVASLKRLDFEELAPAIYFLVRQHQVVYVGQSVKPRARIIQHLAEATKTFDQVFLRHCPADQLDEMESMFIHMLAPEYNCTLDNGNKLAPRDISECQEVAKKLLKLGPSPEEQGGETIQRLPPAKSASYGLRFIRLREVLAKTGLSRSAVYAAMQTGSFPAPVQILPGGRTTAWPEHEIDNWLKSRIDAPRARRATA